MSTVVALQMVSGPDTQANLQQIDKLLSEQTFRQPALVVLPECVACFGGRDSDLLAIAETQGQGPIQDALSDIARRHGVWLVGGTIPVKVPDKDKYFASCLVYDEQGQQRAHYRKIHLFDVQVADNTGDYKESRFTDPGDEVVVVDTPFGRVGVAVCYDLRFPGLFQAMGQVDILVLPSAFTQKTGQAHWMPLLSARAIEKQCYVVAANQGGEHQNGRQTFGHSCVVSPWGEMLSMIEKGPGLAIAAVDDEHIHKIRTAMPVDQHNRFRSTFV
ncbi:carbon-nitrogen hydrolase family protein [Aestuariibacter halophilus]|uniref:Carbon-nitrogen hydrolase family protein n=1 Tax=Fluctibacter halophilus TaxID=226011 RepID=A0ABS8GCT4_9ALTE|nr:carbon-nitrogen hydrolase family protein [Aestuariibacter halophilus]MCC2617655.1 carbon-nitrogen hydrolase family protein [Aestuariibacter halophilus]